MPGLDVGALLALMGQTSRQRNEERLRASEQLGRGIAGAGQGIGRGLASSNQKEHQAAMQKAAQDAGRENRLRHGSTAGTPFARASRIDGWLQSAGSEASRRLPNEICCLRVAACTALT